MGASQICRRDRCEVKNKKNDHATSNHIVLQECVAIDPNTIKNKVDGRLEAARQHQIILKLASDCKKFKAENEKIAGKYNKAKVHVIEFDSIVNDFIALQVKVTAALAEKEEEIEITIIVASAEIKAVKAELEDMKQSNKEKDVQIEKDLDTINVAQTDVEHLEELNKTAERTFEDKMLEFNEIKQEKESDIADLKIIIRDLRKEIEKKVFLFFFSRKKETKNRF